VDGTVGTACAVAVTAEAIKVRVPANNAISTGTRALLFICIPSLSSTALLASTFFPANQHATGRSVSVEMPAYTKRCEVTALRKIFEAVIILMTRDCLPNGVFDNFYMLTRRRPGFFDAQKWFRAE
jgi:hypothetical protein